MTTIKQLTTRLCKFLTRRQIFATTWQESSLLPLRSTSSLPAIQPLSQHTILDVHCYSSAPLVVPNICIVVTTNPQIWVPKYNYVFFHAHVISAAGPHFSPGQLFSTYWPTISSCFGLRISTCFHQQYTFYHNKEESGDLIMLFKYFHLEMMSHFLPSYLSK